jgi:phosphoribosylformylglycinamidine cyclo-ligase
MLAVVAHDHASSVIRALKSRGVPAWHVGEVSTAPRDLTAFEQGAKGVNGGAVRLVGAYARS